MNNHPLITREQNFAFERKQLSVHSSDRNMAVFPHANDFEITMPWELNSVQAVSLGDITFPAVSAIPLPKEQCGFRIAWGEVRADGSGLATRVAKGSAHRGRRHMDILLTPSALVPSVFANTTSGWEALVALINAALADARLAIEKGDADALEEAYKSYFVDCIMLTVLAKANTSFTDDGDIGHHLGTVHKTMNKDAWDAASTKFVKDVSGEGHTPNGLSTGGWWNALLAGTASSAASVDVDKAVTWIKGLTVAPGDPNTADNGNPIEWAVRYHTANGAAGESKLAGKENMVASLEEGRLSFRWSRPFALEDLPGGNRDSGGLTFLQCLGMIDEAPPCLSACPDFALTCKYPVLRSSAATASTAGPSILKGSRHPHVDHEKVIYMEIDNLNAVGELYPAASNPPGHTPLPGRGSAAFARIILDQSADGVPLATTVRAGPVAMNFTVLDPPRDRLSRLRIRFRYHDGEPVDFEGRDVSFTLLFDILHNEIPRSLNLRTPLGLRST